jgi:adducin
LINPYGFLFSEITASSLIKVDPEGEVIEQGSSTFGVTKTGFMFHSIVHEARPEINAVIHVHTGVAAGLSALKCGFLPISQNALLVGHVGYHDYAGLLLDDDMRERIKRDVANYNVLVLRNHGVVAMGRTIEEAWFYLYTFMNAADIQFNALAAAGGVENLVVPPVEVLDQVQKYINAAHIIENTTGSDRIMWGTGDMEFEANMRRLDRLVILLNFRLIQIKLIQLNIILIFI